MRQQLTIDDSLTEAEAMKMLRSLGLQQQVQPRVAAHARHAAIALTVENEVIPRLLQACQQHRADAAQAASKTVMNDAVTALTEILLSGSQSEAAEFVEKMQAAGASRKSLFLNLLTPAARCLGEMWEDDRCDFVEVSVGTLRLANVVRLVSRAFEAEASPVQAGPRALLVQAPGEQHGLGIAMVASFFRRAGWHVQTDPVKDSEALVDIVRQEWFSLVGISVACTSRVDGLAADIRAIRAASRNPAIGIMVGGATFIEHPQLVARIGADCTAADASLAVAQANRLVSRLACQK
jgi:methanogenic corrinoid protein MtbC1